MRVAVLTVSDRCSRGAAEDRGGPAVARAAGRLLAADVVARETVPDDRAAIGERIRALAAVADLVLTTGGTGIGVRDVTPEATGDVVEVEIPGLGERMRLASADRVPAALLSRGRAGALGRAVVLNLPGRPEGAVECLEAVAAALPHAVELRRRPGEDVHAAPAPGGGSA
jgi:molybdopterin adenylyltransferase